MVTIREVAKEAGVSLGTVSRYLNGFRLKNANEEKIKAAIDKLGYEENIIAKGLKNNKSLSIGVVVNTLTDVFATSIVTYLESYLEANNYSLILCDYQNDYQKLEQKLDFLRSRFVDGVVIFHLEKSLPVLARFREIGVPVIAVDSPISDFQTDTVLVDNYQASFNVVKKLSEYGHHQLAIVAGSQDRFIGRERLKGFLDAAEEYKLEKPHVLTGNYLKESGYELTKNFFAVERQVTALYITNYYMTLGAMQAIYELGISIPEEISIVGFDHFELSDILQPKLTVVQQPVKEMGEAIGSLLLNQIKNKDQGPYQEKKFETNLLWRESVKKR